MPLDPSRVLDDRYALDELVGTGGMADVYRATDQLLGRTVAVKMLRETSRGPHRDRFIDEARTLARLNHPGLITLLDAGFEADRPYLVMELAEGPTLAAVIADGPLDPVEVSRIGGELAAALDYAHGAGVIHRDVKPSNVLLCDDGRVLLADFGIARLVGATDHHTLPGEAIGSPAYLAPEQVTGEPLTPAVDVYALGLVLLEAITGVRAYTGPPIEAAVARLSASPDLPPGLGEDWQDLIRAATVREAGERPTAAEVAARLVPVVPDALLATSTAALVLDDGATTQAMRPPLPMSTLRRRWILGAAATTVLVLLATLVVLVSRPVESTASPEVQIPDGVPASLREPLINLHLAVERAGLEVPLLGIDTALARHRYGVARDRIAALVRATDTARRNGEVDGVGADSVLAAAAQLLAALPTPPTPAVATVTPTPARPVARVPAAKPAPPAKAKPAHQSKPKGKPKGKPKPKGKKKR